MIRPKNIMVTIEKIAVGAKSSIKILVVQSSCIWCEDLKKTLLACGIVQSKRMPRNDAVIDEVGKHLLVKYELADLGDVK